MPNSPGSADWLALSGAPIAVGEAVEWATVPECGAVVLFCGTVRDHAPERPNVTSLTYEAYETEVEPRLARIAAEARRQWPDLARIAMVHRTGELSVGETSVAVVVSAPHRPEAFAAARWCIDTLKATVPIWKKERWEGGEDWVQCAHDVEDVPPAPTGTGP